MSTDARYDLPVLGVIRPGASAAALASRNRRVGVIATPATIRSHAYFAAIKDENPAIEVYEHATPALVPLVEAGELRGPMAEAAVADRWRRSSASVTPTASRSSRARRVPRSTRCCSGAPTTRCFGRSSRPRSGSVSRSSNSATATASALAQLLTINALEAPEATPRHLQLTTGDPERFLSVAVRMFGSSFPEVERIDLAVAAR